MREAAHPVAVAHAALTGLLTAGGWQRGSWTTGRPAEGRCPCVGSAAGVLQSVCSYPLERALVRQRLTARDRERDQPGADGRGGLRRLRCQWSGGSRRR